MDTSKVHGEAQQGQHVIYGSKSGGVPEGAVRLSTSQVNTLMMKTIEGWQPSKEMWPLKYGHHILGGVAGVTGAVFISYFRQRMRLLSYGRFVSFIPTIYVPAFVTILTQQTLVTQRLLNPEGREPICPVCIELRAITLQVLSGVIQPLLLSILASSALAKTTASYPLPPVSQWRPLLSSYMTLLRPMRITFCAALIANVVNASVVTYSQSKAAIRVQHKLTDSYFYLA